MAEAASLAARPSRTSRVRRSLAARVLQRLLQNRACGRMPAGMVPAHDWQVFACIGTRFPDDIRPLNVGSVFPYIYRSAGVLLTSHVTEAGEQIWPSGR